MSPKPGRALAMAQRLPLAQRRFENAVAEGARRCGLPGEAVLCAVSGGPDSVALVAALARRAKTLEIQRLGVAYIDHQLRLAAAEEAAAVRRLAAALDLPFYLARVQVQAKGVGLEAGARAARYLALTEMATQADFSVVATGHTRTDQAETVLLRLLRGSGLRGLSAMAEARELSPGVRLCRPLLSLSGADTRAYTAAAKLSTSWDESNADRNIRRNALRLDVWPALAALEPTLELRLYEFARQCREDEAALEALARSASATLLRVAAGAVVLPAKTVAALPPAIARRVLRRAILELRPSAQPSALHLRELLVLCNRGGRGEVHVAGDLTGLLAAGQLTLCPRRR